MKSPPINGITEKPMAVKSGTFERRILSVSVQRADVNVFMLFSFDKDRAELTCQPQKIIFEIFLFHCEMHGRRSSIH